VKPASSVTGPGPSFAVPTADVHDQTVSLRPLTAADCVRLVGWIESEDALYQWSGPAAFTWPLQLLHDLGAESDSRFLFAAADAAGELIGHAKLVVQPHHRHGLLGRVVIAPEHRGRGHGGSLMRALVAYGFDELGLHRLQLGVYTFNAAAIAAYEAAGFTVEGTLRDSTRGSTGYWNGLVMGLLESDRHPDPGAVVAARGADGGADSIRAARFGDRDRVADLLTELGYPHDAAQAGERLAAWAADRHGTVLVAVVDGRVAGVIAVHAIPYFERPGAFARVVALSVDRERRRGGIGRCLVTAAQEWAAAHECVEIEVTSRLARSDAHRFYAALGYADQGGCSDRLTRPVGQSTG